MHVLSGPTADCQQAERAKTTKQREYAEKNTQVSDGWHVSSPDEQQLGGRLESDKGCSFGHIISP